MSKEKMNRKVWTKEEVVILEEMYASKDILATDIARCLGRSIGQVYCKARAMGLKRPREEQVLAGKIGSQSEAAKAHRFRKGSVPPNKGKKMSPEMYARCAPTMFKKGHPNQNHRPVGSERVNVDGYIEVKVAEPNRWRCKHRLVWEEHNGPIPHGYNIQFKDRNRQNVSIDNLYIISRAAQMRYENSLAARYPEELQKVIHLRAAVKRSITMYNRKQQKQSTGNGK